MISASRAAEIFKRKYPNRTIERACLFKNGYLFVAPISDQGLADFNDPFFTVNKLTGVIQKINPVPVMKEIGEAMLHDEIHIGGGNL